MLRILDLRLVLDRDDRVRLSVDGRELMRAAALDEALTFLGARLERIEPRAQLEALAGALVGDIGGGRPATSTRLEVPDVDALEAFDRAWSAAEELGQCDALGGAEYQRVRRAWLERRADGADLATFIRSAANLSPLEASP